MFLRQCSINPSVDQPRNQSINQSSERTSERPADDILPLLPLLLPLISHTPTEPTNERMNAWLGVDGRLVDQES